MKKNRYDQENWEANTHFGLRCATIFIFFNKFRFLLWKSKNKFCHLFNVSVISVPYYSEKKSILVLEFPDQSNLREESFVLSHGTTLCHGKLHYEGRCMSNHCIQSGYRSNESFHSVLFLIIIQLRTQPIKCCYPYLRWL